jgi:hypothetical protein
VRYQRLALSDLDDDDRSLVEFGLSLGAEVVLSGSSTGE